MRVNPVNPQSSIIDLFQEFLKDPDTTTARVKALFDLLSSSKYSSKTFPDASEGFNSIKAALQGQHRMFALHQFRLQLNRLCLPKYHKQLNRMIQNEQAQAYKTVFNDFLNPSHPEFGRRVEQVLLLLQNPQYSYSTTLTDLAGFKKINTFISSIQAKSFIEALSTHLSKNERTEQAAIAKRFKTAIRFNQSNTDASRKHLFTTEATTIINRHDKPPVMMGRGVALTPSDINIANKSAQLIFPEDVLNGAEIRQAIIEDYRAWFLLSDGRVAIMGDHDAGILNPKNASYDRPHIVYAPPINKKPAVRKLAFSGQRGYLLLNNGRLITAKKHPQFSAAQLADKKVSDIINTKACVYTLMTDGSVFIAGQSKGLMINQHKPEEFSCLYAVDGIHPPIKQMVATERGVLLLKQNGEVISSGANILGELGTAETYIDTQGERYDAEGKSLLPGSAKTIDLGDHFSDKYRTEKGLKSVLFPEKISRLISVEHATFYITNSGEVYRSGYNTEVVKTPKLIIDKALLAGRKVKDIVSVKYDSPTDFSKQLTHSLVLLNTGEVLVQGANERGQLGMGAECADVPKFIPLQLPGTTASLKFTSVATGTWDGCPNTLLQTTEGDVYGFGKNNYGQLGLGEAGADTVFELTKMSITPDAVKAPALA